MASGRFPPTPATIRLAGLLAVPAFLVLIAVLAAVNNRTSYENPLLLAILNTVFLGLIPLFIAAIAFRGYQSGRSPGALLLGAGMLTFGLGGIAAGWLIGLPGGANLSVTIYNTLICMGSSLSLAAGILNAACMSY